MLCKTCKKNEHGETRGKTNDFKSKFACILEASESTRMRMEESLPNYHEDHIAGRGDNSLQHYNLVHNFPMPQAMKIPAAKAAVVKEMRETGNDSGVGTDERPKLVRGDRWPWRWGPQGMSITGGGGHVRVPNLRVCKHPFTSGVAHAGGEGRINIRQVGVAILPVSREGGRAGLPQKG